MSIVCGSCRQPGWLLTLRRLTCKAATIDIRTPAGPGSSFTVLRYRPTAGDPGVEPRSGMSVRGTFWNGRRPPARGARAGRGKCGGNTTRATTPSKSCSPISPRRFDFMGGRTLAPERAAARRQVMDKSAALATS